jgi:hypothetical protein
VEQDSNKKNYNDFIDKSNKWVNVYNSLNEKSSKEMKNVYDKMVKIGLIVRCHNVEYKNNKKEQIFDYTLYEKTDGKKDNSKPKKLNSYFTNLKNCLHVLTGPFYGGYIGIDIDVKGKSGLLSQVPYMNAIIKSNELNNTLTCKTPSGGYHYLYKLTVK